MTLKPKQKLRNKKIQESSVQIDLQLYRDSWKTTRGTRVDIAKYICFNHKVTPVVILFCALGCFEKW